MRNTGRQVQEWAHKRSAKGEEEAVQSLDGEEAQGQPRRPAALCSRLMAAWMGGCAGRAGVQALLPRGAKSSHGSEESKIWAGEKKSHKAICLPPCKMAALNHLSGGDGGPGLGTQSCPGSGQPPEPWGLGGQPPLEAPQPLGLRSLAGSTVPGLPCQAARPEARASSPLATDPCLQTQPRGGVGPARARAAGPGRGRPRTAPGTPPAARNQGLVRARAGPAAGKD